MRVFGLAVAGMLALSTPMMGNAAPLGSSMKQAVPASGIVPVWGGCGWGWHPVLGHWSRWWGGWVPPHCASYYGWQSPCGGWDNVYGWAPLRARGCLGRALVSLQRLARPLPWLE